MTTPATVIYQPSYVIDPRMTPIFTQLVMEIGYRPVGVIPTEPPVVITGRVMDRAETRPLGLALALSRNRRPR